MVNPQKTLEDLQAAALPAIGCDSNGNAQYSRDLTPAEQTQADAIIAAELPNGVTKQQAIYKAAVTLAGTVNGVDAQQLTLAQSRNLILLLAAREGWIAFDGSKYTINVH